MSVFRRISEALLAGVVLAAAPALGETAAPERVVSLNVCTDQLAMLVAGEGQLVSISRLTRDPAYSAMADEALAYPVNQGRAEEIYLLAPDLVLSGSFSSLATTEMLRRLGIAVEVFPPANSFADVAGQIRRMGEILGRETVAEKIAIRFDQDLDELRADRASGPRAAFYGAGGWTSGSRTLDGEALSAAGFSNVAEEAGLSDGGMLPLELLALLEPDLVITGGDDGPGFSRRQEIMSHPILARIRAAGRDAGLPGADRVCGTPHILRAVRRLAELRRGLEAR
ncbi:ABC transporter substrate-binding protein [Tropicimonas sp. IMCC34011]|uniref:ABC transporter substrate-binding protein n=1 Tax=Tropicimonas sp. IMCC34011 TaxID=2248759 RepID=UPI000E27E3C5|nr:ABC transporter substrate-binding protein [Tropicimonas sp. IMCC34011]